MAQNIRRHLSFANVASLTALVLAMGGTGYALTIPRNSVGSTQIKKDGVAKSDIRKNAVTSSKVKNRSLLAGDFATGQLPAGAPGAPGATGAQGLQGPAGVVGAVIVKRNPLPVGANPSTGTDVACPAGTKPIGGGASFDSSASDIYLLSSGPYRDADNRFALDGETFDSWRATFGNLDALGTANASVYVICAQT